MLTTRLTFMAVVMTTTMAAMELPITKHFTGGFQCDFCYTLPRPVHGWTAHILFDHAIDQLEVYSAHLVDTRRGNKEFIITNKNYNSDLEAGDDLCLKFTARTQDTELPKVYFYMEGVDNPVDLNGVTQPMTPATPDPQLRASNALWHLGHMPSSSEHDPMAPFHPLSHGKFDEGSFAVVDDPAGLSGKVLRVYYQKGHYIKSSSHRGAQFYSRPTSSRTSMTLSYDIYFSRGFDFVLGGKLPGLYGGATTCSGGRHSDDCFSTRLMWRRHGDGEVYAYIPEHQDSQLCHDSHNHCNPVYGTSLGRGGWRFQTSEWQTITQRLTLNTPGHLNGKVKVWHNGHQVLDLTNLNIRTHSDLKIDGLFFSTFFGGSSPSWAATADCYTYFKNFVISPGEDDESVIG